MLSRLNVFTTDRLAKLAYFAFDCFEDFAGLYEGFHGIVVRVEWTVDLEMSNVPSDNFTGFLGALTGCEFTEIQRLGSRHEFDTQHPIGIIQDLAILEGSIHAH